LPAARKRPVASQYSSASPAPLITGALSVVLSAALVVVSIAAGTPANVLGLSLPMVPSASWSLSFAGYVLTPMLVTIALGWDRIAQRRGVRDRNFVLRPQYGTWLRILLVAGFAVSLWHILNLAYIVAAALTQEWNLG
jgi:hypothetical protein